MASEGRRLLLLECLATGRRAGAASAQGQDGRRFACALGWVLIGGCTSGEAGRRAGVEAWRVDLLVRRLRRRLAAQGVELPRRKAVSNRPAPSPPHAAEAAK